jgi:hypothetical protein
MKYIIILFFVVLSMSSAHGQFGACDCSADVPNNSGFINFNALTWTGTGCPDATSTSYTGNLCISIGSSAGVRFTQNITINGDLKITTYGVASRIRIPTGITLQVNGDMGDDTNNNAQFEIDGSLIVSGGIYGKNNTQFDAGGSGTGSVTAGLIVLENNTSCAAPSNCTGINWNVGDCSPSSSSFCQTVMALPVSLLYFETKINGSVVELSWATAMETNSSHFVVERSVDGKNFHEIGTKSGAGNSVQRKDYALIDRSPLIGRAYYRLKEVDNDGYTEHFNMKFVDFTGKKGLLIYPNPVANPETVTLSLNFSNDEIAFVKISDLSGHEIQKFSFAGTETKLPFNPARGTYVVSITTGGKTYVSRLIVQ